MDPFPLVGGRTARSMTTGGCTVIRRTRREVCIGGAASVVWSLIRSMDGRSTVADIVSALPEGDRERGIRTLGALIATGVVDLSGRAIGRFVHWTTRKGVLAAGGLEAEDVLRLATDGQHRAHEDLPRIPLRRRHSGAAPPFHELTRRRRSRRDYHGDHAEPRGVRRACSPRRAGLPGRSHGRTRGEAARLSLQRGVSTRWASTRSCSASRD